MEEKDIERSTSFVIDMTDTHNEDGKTKRRGAAERRLASYKYKQISKERILKRQAEAALRKEVTEFVFTNDNLIKFMHIVCCCC